VPLAARSGDGAASHRLTPEARAEFVALFTGPRPPPGKDRWHHRQYDLVRLDDRTIGFVSNALDAELKQIIDEAIEELFRSLRKIGIDQGWWARSCRLRSPTVRF
jgi:hypothetical protein